MKRLSKQQADRHDNLVTRLTACRDELNKAITEFNAEVQRLHEKLLVPQVAYLNEAIIEANEFVEEVHGEQESYHDERSEKWQEGDAGQAYSDWMGEWDLSLDELELEEPTPFDEVKINVDDFENLEHEVSS